MNKVMELYKVFVEIERSRHIGDNILEIADGVGKLAGIDDFKSLTIKIGKVSLK